MVFEVMAGALFGVSSLAVSRSIHQVAKESVDLGRAHREAVGSFAEAVLQSSDLATKRMGVVMVEGVDRFNANVTELMQNLLTEVEIRGSVIHQDTQAAIQVFAEAAENFHEQFRSFNRRLFWMPIICSVIIGGSLVISANILTNGIESFGLLKSNLLCVETRLPKFSNAN